MESPDRRRCSVCNYESEASPELPLSQGTPDTDCLPAVYLHRTRKSGEYADIFGLNLWKEVAAYSKMRIGTDRSGLFGLRGLGPGFQSLTICLLEEICEKVSLFRFGPKIKI